MSRPSSARLVCLSQVKDHVRRTVEFCALHGAAVLLTWALVYPAQQALLGESLRSSVFFVPVLLFLPAVVKALATWMYAWWAAVYIFPTALLQHVMLGFGWSAQHLLLLLAYLITPPLVRSLLHFVGLDMRPGSHLKSWRSMFAIMLMSSIAIGSALILILGVDLSFVQALIFIGLVALGDAAGATVVLLSLILFFRRRDLARRQIARQDEV